MSWRRLSFAPGIRMPFYGFGVFGVGRVFPGKRQALLRVAGKARPSRDLAVPGLVGLWLHSLPGAFPPRAVLALP